MIFTSQATVEWFRIYKMPDGKPANEFAFNSEPKNKEFAENIIAGCHESWKKLSRYFNIIFGVSFSSFELSYISPLFDNLTQNVYYETERGYSDNPNITDIPFTCFK